MSVTGQKIGIVGSGLIGRAWSMLFASVGYKVVLYDILPEQINAALSELEHEVNRLAALGRLRGTLTAVEQLACITATTNVQELLKDAFYIQECIPEQIELKRQLYKQLDDLLDGATTIVASSTSTFMPSLFSEGLQHKAQMLVAHPLNPPYYIPLVEIVPAPWTRPEVIERTRALMHEIGQKPVTLKREIEGFATNRIQYAILNEVWRLVEDGLISVADIDRVVTQGLGLRYAMLGPLETAHLNANGVADYFARFGGEIYAVSQTYGPTPQMKPGATLTRIAEETEALVPRNQLATRRAQRDEFLTQLSKLKQNLEEAQD